jgi:hypothetical protein
LDLHPPKYSLIEVEWRRKTPHHRRMAFITIEHRHTVSQCIASIAKRARALSPRIEGVVPTNNGVLTLELKMQMKQDHPRI